MTGRASQPPGFSQGEDVSTPSIPYEPELSEEVASKRTSLRTGWTTGSCAAAAAKAAAMALLSDAIPDQVEIALPKGKRVVFSVELPEIPPLQGATAVVVKDGGDDPDCTNGARMTAHVTWAKNKVDGHELRAGEGVGVVTKKGLGIPLGEPSITPVPRRMILNALAEVTDRPLRVTFSVPGGVEMAEQTTNARLGILGGISILGTTGIVRPFSTAAYRASIVRQIDVAFAQGERRLALATGSRSEAAAMALFPSLDPVCFVEVGDFTGVAIRQAAKLGMERVALVAMIGKITKLASGIMMTHFHRSNVDTDLLKEISKRSNAPSSVVDASTQTATARYFFEACLASSTLGPLNDLCAMARDTLLSYARGNSPGSRMNIEVYMVDFEGSMVVAHA